jgi:hypothetical protein
VDPEKTNFDWEKYIEVYKDLQHIKDKKTAWDHWINYGKNEGCRAEQEGRSSCRS